MTRVTLIFRPKEDGPAEACPAEGSPAEGSPAEAGGQTASNLSMTWYPNQHEIQKSGIWSKPDE